MRPCFALLALALCPVPLVGYAGAQELPSGSNAAFREKMVERAEPVALPVLPPPSRTERSRPGRSTVNLPRLSSSFGYREHPILGHRAMHAGIDIPGRLGTTIYASGNGVVRFSGRAGGYGEMIEIDHGNGMTTRYAHLSRLLVAPGTPVARGEAIALMGSTGRSTGSHLHFEVRVNGHATNPLSYLGAPYSSATGASILSSGMDWAASRGPYLSHYARARLAGKQAE